MNDSQGYTQESNDEEDAAERRKLVGNKRGALKKTSRITKRRRT